MKNKQHLRTSQLEIIDFIKRTPKCALWLRMGCGKTIISLTSIVEIINDYKNKHDEKLKVLIIAPLNVAQKVWHKEAKLWEHTTNLKFSIVVGDEKNRLNALKEDADCYVINVENTFWLFGYETTENNKKIKITGKVPHNFFNMIILDEASCFKNKSSKRFKVLKCKYQRSKMVVDYDRMIQLTGTPSPNSLIDIWSQIYLLDGGERLGKTFDTYLYRYFRKINQYEWECIYPEQIYKAISDIVVSMKSEYENDLPEIQYLHTVVSIGNYSKYKELQKKFCIEVEGKNIEAKKVVSLSQKLSQYANGALYHEVGNKDYVVVHNVKLDVLQNMIDEYPNENFLVVYLFDSDKRRLLDKFKFAVAFDSDKDVVEKWNSAKIKMLLAHPGSAAMGLNLQFGGRMIVWFGITWNLQDYLQMNKRLHREGQTKKCIIQHIVASNTIDERIINVLKDKEVTQNKLLEAVKYG